MKTVIEHEDVELIAERVAAILKPFLAQKTENEDTIFSVEELSEYLRVSNKWVYDHAHELPKFKLGGCLRFKKKDIDREIDKLFLKETAKKRPERNGQKP